MLSHLTHITPTLSSSDFIVVDTADAYGRALERLVSVVKKWTDRRRKSTQPPISPTLASTEASSPPPSRHLSALLSTPSLPPSPSAPSPVSCSLSTEEILQRLATMSVAVLSRSTIDAEKALRILHTLTCIRGTLPLLLQLSTLSFLTPYLSTSYPSSTVAAALKSAIGVVGGGDGAYSGFVQGENRRGVLSSIKKPQGNSSTLSQPLPRLASLIACSTSQTTRPRCPRY